MQEIAAESIRATAEPTRRQRQTQEERAKLRKQRERALLTATTAFCHESTAGPSIAAATYANIQEPLARMWTLPHVLQAHFVETPVNTLAK